MTTCGKSGLTVVLECPDSATLQWQRLATPAEVGQLHAMGELPPHETEARVPVYACDEHQISPERSAQTHDATCRAPADPGECQVCQGT